MIFLLCAPNENSYKNNLCKEMQAHNVKNLLVAKKDPVKNMKQCYGEHYIKILSITFVTQVNGLHSDKLLITWMELINSLFYELFSYYTRITLILYWPLGKIMFYRI